MKKGVRPTHPLNIRKHYHIKSNAKMVTLSRFALSFNKKEANKFALKCARTASASLNIPFKGGPFGNDGLAFYVIGEKYIEVITCEEYGVDHIITK